MTSAVLQKTHFISNLPALESAITELGGFKNQGAAG